ncbi:MAG TPA: ABC transporter permease [Chryseosolibacter sp.]
MAYSPPRLAHKLLMLFLREDLAEEVEGDLEEQFHSVARKRSVARAKVNYWYQVFRYMRPFAIRKVKGTHSNLHIMFRHNLLISFRNFNKFKASFLINVLGLSTGVAAALLVYLWVNEELRMDKFHSRDSQLYQVLKTAPQGDGSLTTMEQTPGLMAQAMREDLPEVEYAVSVLPPRDNSILSSNDRHVKARHQFVSDDYFNVFSYPLIEGNKNHPFRDKRSVLLSDELAMKLFNSTENIIGKTVAWEWWDKFNGEYTVTGIFKSPPSNSSAQFDAVFCHALWVETINDRCWCSNNVSTYLVLKEDTDIDAFNKKIIDYSKAKLKQLEGAGALKWEGTLSVQRYSDRYLYDHYVNGVQAGGKIQYVRLFSGLGLAILLIACINFMNLSTARASRRLKEVGIKKVVGAQRGALIVQFIGESLIVTAFAVAVAIVLTYVLLPRFNEITGRQIILRFDRDLLFGIAGITLLTGILSGSYPALYLSAFRPALVLKARPKHAASESWIRKGLVVSQFAISVVLITGVVVVYKQVGFMLSMDLGYNRDNVIRFENEGKLRRGSTAFLAEIRKIPGVVSASTMSGDLVGNHSGGGGIEWEGKTTGIEFSGLYVDYELLEMLGVRMAEGRSFSQERGSDSDKVIFNETAISMMGLKDPVGKTVIMWGARKEIIGVVKDFHYESLYQPVGPFFFAYGEKNTTTLVRIAAGSVRRTLSQIGELYTAFNEGLPFDFHFLDEDYQRLYAAESRVSILSRYFAAVAVMISCLGLFGLAAFTAEKRTKEIGIRKVLGSSSLGIVYLLTGDFGRLVLVSIFIAVPASFVLLDGWLSRFAFRISLEWWFFTGAAAITLAIALLAVGTQTLRAASINPAECLKHE